MHKLVIQRKYCNLAFIFGKTERIEYRTEKNSQQKIDLTDLQTLCGKTDTVALLYNAQHHWTYINKDKTLEQVNSNHMEIMLKNTLLRFICKRIWIMLYQPQKLASSLLSKLTCTIAAITLWFITAEHITIEKLSRFLSTYATTKRRNRIFTRTPPSPSKVVLILYWFLTGNSVVPLFQKI